MNDIKTYQMDAFVPDNLLLVLETMMLERSNDSEWHGGGKRKKK